MLTAVLGFFGNVGSWYSAIRNIISCFKDLITSTSYNRIYLPEPLAGAKFAEELSRICDERKCYHINIWLNELYLFRQEYLRYKDSRAR